MIFSSIITALKTHIKPVGAFLGAGLIFCIGFYFGRTTGAPKIKEVQVEVPVVKTETVTQTQTVIKYVEKPSPDAADIDVKIPLQEIKVAVNGKEQVIKKADSEKYVFDDYQLKLEQKSEARLDVKIPTVDKTRRWAVGIGASKNGAAYMLKFPVKGNVGGWAYGDRKTVAGGLSFNF